MMNFICADQANGTSTIIIYVVLIVALVAMLIMPYFTQRKKNREFMEMIDSMKVGDLVKTAGGIIGKITKITDKGDIKTVILETGSKTEKSYMEFDMTMIYCVLKSTKVEETKEEVKEEVAEETPAEEVKEEVKAEEKKTTKKTSTTKKAPAKKTTSKTTAKKSTAKKTTEK